MKHRGSGKIKKQHSIINGLQKLLESIEHWPEINSIIPGVINQTSSFKHLEVDVKYQTSTGLKAIARSNNAVQELFFVSNEPKALWTKLDSLKN